MSNKNITREDLKQAVLALEGISLQRHYGPIVRGRAYDHSCRLRGILDVEIKKILEPINKKLLFVKESVEDEVEQDVANGMEVKNKERYILHRFNNHPVKQQLDQEIKDFWAGPVVNRVPTVNLPGLQCEEGVLKVKNEQGEWDLDLSLIYKHLVEETQIVTIEEESNKKPTKKGKDGKNND